MLRLFAIITVVAVLCLTLCGCSQNINKPTIVTSDFSADVEFSYEDNQYKADLIFNNTNNFELYFNAPDFISGLNVKMTAGEPKVTFNGLDANGMYDYSSILFMAKALKESEINPEYDSDDRKLECGEFDLYIDENGFVNKITVDDFDVEIRLSNHKLLRDNIK